MRCLEEPHCRRSIGCCWESSSIHILREQITRKLAALVELTSVRKESIETVVSNSICTLLGVNDSGV